MDGVNGEGEAGSTHTATLSVGGDCGAAAALHSLPAASVGRVMTAAIARLAASTIREDVNRRCMQACTSIQFPAQCGSRGVKAVFSAYSARAEPTGDSSLHL